ncbi:MAG: hypothetical protein ACQEXX_06360 [Bacillota bacterium]
MEKQREVLAKGTRGNVLQIFEDKTLADEAWDCAASKYRPSID